MDTSEFREFGKAAVDYIGDYMDNIRECDVLPSVKPGYLYKLLPQNMPEKPEDWKVILEDVDRVIKPGLTHWQSPNMHAFYPASNSYASIVGDLLCNGFNVIGLSWMSSPACTELEAIVMDWLAKFLKLPEVFLHSSAGPGGGIIKGTASESILIALTTARELKVRSVQEQHPEMSVSDIRSKLVAYTSDQSNYIIEKACIVTAVPIRLVATGDDFVFNGSLLAAAVQEDVAQGLIPIFCIGNLGTTGTCAFDDIATLGEVCEKHNMWLHVDAAYAGSALALDEFAEIRKGLELVDSLNVNAHKFLNVNPHCVAMWLRDAGKVVECFNIDRIYLTHHYERETHIPDFRHWQLPLTRCFRALKMWVTFRSFGAEALRAFMRHHSTLAKRFEDYVLEDSRFEIVAKRCLGLVCFRAKGDNRLTIGLLHRLNERKKIFIIQAKHRGKNYLRFVICGMDAREEDVDFAWREIQTQMDVVVERGRQGVAKEDIQILSE